MGGPIKLQGVGKIENLISRGAFIWHLRVVTTATSSRYSVVCVCVCVCVCVLGGGGEWNSDLKWMDDS